MPNVVGKQLTLADERRAPQRTSLRSNVVLRPATSPTGTVLTQNPARQPDGEIGHRGKPDGVRDADGGHLAGAQRGRDHLPAAAGSARRPSNLHRRATRPPSLLVERRQRPGGDPEPGRRLSQVQPNTPVNLARVSSGPVLGGHPQRKVGDRMQTAELSATPATRGRLDGPDVPGFDHRIDVAARTATARRITVGARRPPAATDVDHAGTTVTLTVCSYRCRPTTSTTSTVTLPRPRAPVADEATTSTTTGPPNPSSSRLTGCPPPPPWTAGRSWPAAPGPEAREDRLGVELHPFDPAVRGDAGP